MKTLKDYDLQRGDYVKFADGQGWKEFDALTNYYWFNNVSYSPSYEVESVLRPSVIIRDNIGIPAFNLYPQTITFQNIHPKEEKKSLFEKVREIDPVFDANYRAVARFFCDEIDKLKEGKK